MAKLNPRDLKYLRALAATDVRLLGGAASVDVKLLAALLEEYDRTDALAAQVAQHERGVASWLAEEALWKEREAALVARVAELEALIMRHTDLCPFGGGADGKRVACAFGHPGCECADWYSQLPPAKAGSL